MGAGFGVGLPAANGPQIVIAAVVANGGPVVRPQALAGEKIALQFDRVVVFAELQLDQILP